jgi:hypothetical protein
MSEIAMLRQSVAFATVLGRKLGGYSCLSLSKKQRNHEDSNPVAVTHNSSDRSQPSSTTLLSQRQCSKAGTRWDYCSWSVKFWHLELILIMKSHVSASICCSRTYVRFVTCGSPLARIKTFQRTWVQRKEVVNDQFPQFCDSTECSLFNMRQAGQLRDKQN